MDIDARKLAGGIYSTWAQGTYLYVKWAANRGINYYELLVLYALDNYESMTQKAIGDYFGLPKQTVHNVIRSLKEEKYIILKSGRADKREKCVSLTESGKLYADKILAPLYSLEERVCKNIGEQRLIRMIETSELFNTLFESEMEKGRVYDGV